MIALILQAKPEVIFDEIENNILFIREQIPRIAVFNYTITLLAKEEYQTKFILLGNDTLKNFQMDVTHELKILATEENITINDSKLLLDSSKDYELKVQILKNG